MNTLRIALADDEPDVLADLEETVAELGHEVVATAQNGNDLVARCRETSPDLIITDIKMPDMDGLDAVDEIRKQRPTPVIIVSAYHDPEFVERSLKEHVLAFLVKPVSDQSLKTSIELAMQRFKEFEALHEEAAGLQQALEDRKLIERAKGVLMKRADLNEPDAFRRLQLLSSQKNQKMIEIARTIVEADQAFEG